MSCQIVRSCGKWSHCTPTEHSIADAYATIIRNSEHFVYIENQFFITATSDAQKPVRNRIGSAIVERILRAARAKQKYQIIVVMPAIPGFAGDLRDDSSLGTRAIIEFQYNSINRGGNSIMEAIAKEGHNPMEYIRFYNLRNYDRINASAAMKKTEHQSGVSYEDARKQHDAAVGAPTGSAFDTTASYQQYQQAAHQVAPSLPTGSGRWDTVAECYMLGGEDIRKVPWEYHGDMSEIDAFVSEELYVHSKVECLPSLPSFSCCHFVFFLLWGFNFLTASCRF
jgi:phospholipase D1/2